MPNMSDWLGKKVLIIGDAMLDKYLYCNVGRISPEAPVPVVNILSKRESLGGAGNVAQNVVALGGRAILIAIVGKDEDGQSLIRKIKTQHIDWQGLEIPGRPTTVKTRIATEQQQILRIDMEEITEVPLEFEKILFKKVKKLIANIDIVIISDYLKGLLTYTLVKDVIQIAKKYGVPVLVDPKDKNIEKYSGSTFIKPNLLEAEAMLGKPLHNKSEVKESISNLCKIGDIEMAMITQGHDGLTIFSQGQTVHFSSISREVFDITGAGDTVLAVTALGLTVTRDVNWIGNLAVHSGSIAVSKKGTGAISIEELAISMNNNIGSKVLSINQLELMAKIWREEGKKIVFTNGCFDILHSGHIKLLQEAKKFGEILIVAVNSDGSIRRIKGDLRPILSLDDRLKVLSAIEYVDNIVVFEDDTPIKMIEAIRPHTLVKGSDYTINEVVGGKIVESYGGNVKLVELKDGISTTKIVNRICSSVV